MADAIGNTEQISKSKARRVRRKQRQFAKEIAKFLLYVSLGFAWGYLIAIQVFVIG